MTSTTLMADLVLPAATWYEKHDLSSTDMHPYVHAFSPAIDPPWQARTDFEIFHGLAAKLSELAAGRLDTAHDLVATALHHDTPGELAQPRRHRPDKNRLQPGRCADPLPHGGDRVSVADLLKGVTVTDLTVCARSIPTPKDFLLTQSVFAEAQVKGIKSRSLGHPRVRGKRASR